MKTIKIISAAIIVISIFTFASTGNKAPQKVKEAFSKKFPTVKKVKWEKENATEWEAEFKINKVEYSANFLEDGTWQETEHEIDEKTIPHNIKTVLTEAFPGYEIEEAEISETNNGTVYEFEFEKGENNMEVVIVFDGNIIKKEHFAEGEDNDNEGND